MVGVLGGALSVSLIAVVSVLGVARDLPADLAALSAWQSPNLSTIVDAGQSPRGELRLVESSAWPGDDHEELVEAFISAAPKSFYEARSRRATSLGPALRRAFGGEAPPASALSIELARLLLATESSGPVRRVREDLVATWLDAEVSVSSRAIAWLDRAPICLGHRGLVRAARACFGRPLEQLGLADLAAIAVAATWRLDLAGDPEQIRMRRAQVLDELLTRSRVTAAEATAFARSPIFAPHPEGPEAWVELIGLGVRHRLGRGNESRAARIETSLQWPLQQALSTQLGSDGIWLAVRPATNAVVAVGGDVLARRGSDDPSVGDVVCWAAAVVDAASASGRLSPDPVRTSPPRWSQRVVLAADSRRNREVVEWGVGNDPLGGVGTHPALRARPEELLGVDTLTDLSPQGPWRSTEAHGVRLLLHGALVVGWAGPDPVAVADAVAGPAFSRPERFAWTNDAEPGEATPQ